MDWNQLWQQLLEAIREHWAKALLPMLGLAVGWWWGRRRARREWSQKQFLSRLNVSLNLFETAADGSRVLRIRTLLEKDAKDVFLNDVAVERVQAAATRTSDGDPILPLGEDAWYLLNAVLNEISEKFALGHLKRDLGIPTRSAPYLIALTYEHAGSLRTRKVRAMVTRKDVLLSLLPRPAEEHGPPLPPPMPQLESPRHDVRFRTLCQLALAYQRDPEQFLEIEIAV